MKYIYKLYKFGHFLDQSYEKNINSFNQFLIEHFYLEKNTIDQIRKKENFVEKNSEFVISELVDGIPWVRQDIFLCVTKLLHKNILYLKVFVF